MIRNTKNNEAKREAGMKAKSVRATWTIGNVTTIICNYDVRVGYGRTGTSDVEEIEITTLDNIYKLSRMWK
jgi:hypothetical protein